MPEQQILISKASGQKEPFDIEKFERSLTRVKASPAIIKKVTGHILQELEDGMSTKDIYHHAFDILHKFERGAAIRYSLRKALLELGPSGFPFEKFVAKILQSKGYETLTDQMVKGFCAEHEVDVVAWKPDNLLMLEAKFHNQPGIKSDLKIVLYIKARFEDLAKSHFMYGNITRPMSEGWLVTNTKFTISALKYAECQNLKIVGWNYPADGNLQDLIEAANLHPLTCLKSLSDHDKKLLLDSGIVLCKELVENEKPLHAIGLSAANIEAVQEEINLLYAPAAK